MLDTVSKILSTWFIELLQIFASNPLLMDDMFAHSMDGLLSKWHVHPLYIVCTKQFSYLALTVVFEELLPSKLFSPIAYKILYAEAKIAESVSHANFSLEQLTVLSTKCLFQYGTWITHGYGFTLPKVLVQ